MSEKSELAELPEWVPMYLSCWGSTKPDGGRMTVTFAAEFAGVRARTVRALRERSPSFRRMEWMARHGTSEWASEFVDRGLRGAAPLIVAAFYKLIAAGEKQVVLKGMEWLRGRPQELKLSGGMGLGVADVSEMSEEQLRQMLENLQVLETIDGDGLGMDGWEGDEAEEE